MRYARMAAAAVFLVILAACQPVPPAPAVPPEVARMQARLDAIEQLQGQTLVELADAIQRLPEPIPPPEVGLRCMLPEPLTVVVDNRGRIVGRVALCALAQPAPDEGK